MAVDGARSVGEPLNDPPACALALIASRWVPKGRTRLAGLAAHLAQEPQHVSRVTRNGQDPNMARTPIYIDAIRGDIGGSGAQYDIYSVDQVTKNAMD